MSDLTISDLMEIAAQAGVFKQMSTQRSRRVVVDYCPPRTAMAIPRKPDEDEPITPITPEVQTLTFTLEDAMFGGVVFVALTCAERVIVHPFAWVSYEHLGTIRLSR